MLEPERQTTRLHRFIEWGLVLLCTVSFLVYLLHSRAAETYGALYVKLLGKLPMVLGN